MPRRSVHVVIGAVAGLAAGVATAPRGSDGARATHIVAALLAGVLGGIAPDVLEPAISPRHRSTFHSVSAAGGLGFAAFAKQHARCIEMAAACDQRAAELIPGSDEHNRQLLHAFLWRVGAGAIVGLIAGYGSHLALDAATTSGLPLLGNGV
jgi:membrane-bound metal-dependent hydrolase YbcI (DUF457 family)